MATKSTRRAVQGVRDPDGETPATGGIQIRKTVTINRPRRDVYAFWRQMENFPRFMKHVESVQEQSPQQSHWVVKAPAGKHVEWDAVLMGERADEFLSWRTAEEADVQNAGSVTFRDAPAGRGTEVSVTLTYNPPAGRAGSTLAMLLGEEPSQQVADDLRRAKAVLETGEAPTADYRRPAEPMEMRRAS
jgi:uncharacterized membrane protein